MEVKPNMNKDVNKSMKNKMQRLSHVLLLFIIKLCINHIRVCMTLNLNCIFLSQLVGLVFVFADSVTFATNIEHTLAKQE